MAAKARFSAELLAGEMPREIDEAFRAAGASLFPERRAELATRCSCPDWGDPCKHVAATHYVLGEALDRDPFLLFELRGRSREQVLDALREARTQAEAGAPTGKHPQAKPKRSQQKSARAPAKGRPQPSAQAGRGRAGTATSADDALPPVPTVALGRLTPKDYDRMRVPLAPLAFSFEPPSADAALVRQLGVPRGWSLEQSPADRLAPIVAAAAEHARRLALREPEPVVEADAERAASDAPRPGSAAPRARKRKSR
jgi:hypothetical protein